MENSESKKQQILAPILQHRCLGPGLFQMRLRAPSIAGSLKPGQFVNIKVSETTVPLLRRPISIHNTDGKDWIEIVYAVVGGGTVLLSEKKEGETLSLLGPLGSPFPIDFDSETKVILVGGGLGIPPIHFLAKKLSENKTPFHVFLGARSANQLIGKIEFSKMTQNLWLASDDGSAGFQGTVIDLLEERWVLSKLNEGTIQIYSCGPEPMLKALTEWAIEKKAALYVSMESVMGCGFGICLGCPIETDNGMKLVCKDGPVFNGHSIRW